MSDDGVEQFWDLVEPMIAADEAEEGTIMGGRCLRVDGEFLAMPYHKGPGLVVKLPGDRVSELIEEGTGLPFAPAGRVFKEWVHVPGEDDDLWLELLAEGRRFVSDG